MKFFALILIFTCSLALRAQQRSFVIAGTIKGDETFRYAYCFDSQYKLIAKKVVNDRSFEIQGIYNMDNPSIRRFGSLPAVNIYLSNLDELPLDEKFGNRQKNQCRAFLSDTITVLYDSNKKAFKLGNSAENLLQTKFEKIYSNYRNERDITHLVIEQTQLKEAEKIDKKILKSRTLFFKATQQVAKLCEINYDNEVSMMNFSSVIYEQLMPGDSVLKYFNQFSPRLKNSVRGKYLFKDVADKLRSEKVMGAPPVVVGMKMPSFTLPNTKGDQVLSTSKYGRYTLIDFWASWCIPCRKESPNLINAVKRFQENGFEVITVSIDEIKDKPAWQKAVKDDGMGSLVNLLNDDLTSNIVSLLKIVAIPQNFLLDKDGTVIAVNLRGEMLNEKLKSLFGN